VYPVAEFTDRVDAFARRLAGMPREALGLAKVAIDTAATVDRRTARDFDRMAQTLLFTSDDFRAKIEAFMHRGAEKD
jgi:enoyl-CoA hydratase/carnithine racemase